MAYNSRMAAALSGSTLSQLRHWRRPSSQGKVVLAPEIQARPRVLYSFRDLLALRTCVYLRESVSLQKIRRAISNLRDLGEADHLSAYRLVTDGSTIQLVGADEAIDLVSRQGQRQLVVAIGDVIEPFPVRAGVVVPHLLRPRERVSVDPATRGGQPVISGTRVPYNLVAELVRDGVPEDSVSDYYPSVTGDAARDAVDFARYIDSYSAAFRVGYDTSPSAA